jgi:spore coat protein U-like protein
MRFTKLCLFLASISALVLSSDRGALAGSAPANLTVSATVNNNCSIATSPVTFAVYDPLSATDNDSTGGSVIITCTKNAVTTIGLNFGSNAGGVSPAKMSDGASTPSFLTYALYSNSGRSTLWSGAVFDTGTAPSKAARPFTVYGRITAGQDVPAGTFTDTVLATVNF